MKTKWPEASASNKEAGWKLSLEFLTQIENYLADEELLTPAEDIQATLLAADKVTERWKDWRGERTYMGWPAASEDVKELGGFLDCEFIEEVTELTETCHEFIWAEETEMILLKAEQILKQGVKRKDS